MRPVIGITTYAEEATWGGWTEPAAFTPLAYVRAVEQAGGRALARPAERRRDRGDARRARRDHLLGRRRPRPGDRTAPKRIPRPRRSLAERDSAELALLQAALGRDMPVLAVCRGSQVLNVARGGDLVQHLPEIVGHDRHRHTEPVMADHEVTVEVESKLGSILGDARAGQVVAPPGVRPSRRGPPRGRLGRGRDGRSARGSIPPLRARRALAPGGGRGLRALQGARGRSGRVPQLARDGQHDLAELARRPPSAHGRRGPRTAGTPRRRSASPVRSSRARRRPRSPSSFPSSSRRSRAASTTPGGARPADSARSSRRTR